jgi:CheY-like chemotaxis protein
MMNMPAPLVLVVEDEPAQRDVLAYNLEAEGFRVNQSENGEEALLMAVEERPDLIVPSDQDPRGHAQRADHHAVGPFRRGRSGARAGNRRG